MYHLLATHFSFRVSQNILRPCTLRYEGTTASFSSSESQVLLSLSPRWLCGWPRLSSSLDLDSWKWFPRLFFFSLCLSANPSLVQQIFIELPRHWLLWSGAESEKMNKTSFGLERDGPQSMWFKGPHFPISRMIKAELPALLFVVFSYCLWFLIVSGWPLCFQLFHPFSGF